MRIEHIERSKHKASRVLVFLEDGTMIKITEQELLDFSLRAGDLLDETRLQQLKGAADRSKAKAEAAKLIGRKAMSSRDLQRKLKEKGATEVESRYAVEWLEAIGALDDEAYAASLARHYAQRGYGARYIREKLAEKGVPRELWDEALEQLADPLDDMRRVLEKRLAGKKQPDAKEAKRLTDFFLRRGFSWTQVRAVMEEVTSGLEEE